MISSYYSVGHKVRYIDQVGELGATFGAIGTIVEVDGDDLAMTYRVAFPGVGKSYWHLNQNLEIVPDDSDPVCGWKERALRVEQELAELKKALKTLTEG